MLPRLEPIRFSGDVERFHEFVLCYDTLVAQFTTSSDERFVYLYSYLDGEARDLVSACVYMKGSECYDTARRLLENEYGDSLKLAMLFVCKLKSWPAIVEEDCLGLKHFAMFLNKCQQAMATIPDLSVLKDSLNLQEVVRKFPSSFHDRWLTTDG